MKPEEDKPMIGTTFGTLGAGIPKDIDVDASGLVHPGTGGMSVFSSLRELPARSVTRRLRHLVPDASGQDKFCVWSMGQGHFVPGPVSDRLQLRPDTGNHAHGFVEPQQPMHSDDYQDALASTRDMWSIDEK